MLASVGGGGLIGGISMAMKQLSPDTRIIGCQPENDNAMQVSLLEGKIVDIEAKDTISDGTAGNIEQGAITFQLCQENVDEIYSVPEDSIAKGLY